MTYSRAWCSMLEKGGALHVPDHVGGNTEDAGDLAQLEISRLNKLCVVERDRHLLPLHPLFEDRRPKGVPEAGVDAGELLAEGVAFFLVAEAPVHLDDPARASSAPEEPRAELFGCEAEADGLFVHADGGVPLQPVEAEAWDMEDLGRSQGEFPRAAADRYLRVVR